MGWVVLEGAHSVSSTRYGLLDVIFYLLSKDFINLLL